MLRAVLLIARKDLVERVRDRSALLYGLLVPLGLSFVFSQVFAGLDGDLDLALGVVDADGSAAGAQVVEVVERAVEEAGLGAITVLPDEDAAREAITDGGVDAVVLVPAGFGAAVDTGVAASLEVLASADAPVARSVAEGVAGGYAAQLDRVRAAVVAEVRAGADPAALDVQAIAARVLATPPALALDADEVDDGRLDPVTYLSAGMAVFFLFFTVSFGITGLLEERRVGTLPRLLAAPVPRASVVVAKGVTSAVLGITSMSVLVVASTLLLGARWGDPVGVVALVLAGVAAATGVMALLATFARTAEQAQSAQSIVAVLLGMLGGAFFPIEGAGGALGALSRLSPHRWFLTGLGDLAAGGGLPDVAGEAGVMLLFAVGAGGVAVARLRGEELA
ncbi:MAG: ABC transporter permease [Actinomycetes bacterium]